MSRDAHAGLLKSAGIVSLMTLFSRLTGLVVQMTTNGMLGATGIGDAYQVAWRLPNMLRRFTAEGTMTASMLPTLAEVEHRDGEAAARQFVRDFLGSLAWILGLLVLIGVLAMAPIIGVQMLGKLAPNRPLGEQFEALISALLGTSHFPSDVALATLLGRLMFPYLLLVSLTAGMAAVLNLRGRFAMAASVSTFFNLSFLVCSWSAFGIGNAAWRMPERAAVIFACAVLVGGVVQILVMVPTYRQLRFSFGMRMHLENPDVRLALRRMGPGILAGGIHPINVLVSTSLASQLGYGAQTVLNTSNLMGELVLGLFAMSMATVSLPAMSKLAAAKDYAGVRASLATALRGTALLAIPASVGLAVLAQPIIAVLFQRGRFDAASVAWTASTLPYQALGILAIASARIGTQALNAMKDYRSPALAAVVSLIANMVLSLLLMGPLGTGGMALANGLAALCGLLFQERRLKQTLAELPYRQVFSGWGVMTAAAALMGLFAWGGGLYLDIFTFHGTWGTAARLFPLMAACGVLYFGVLMALSVPETKLLVQAVKRRLGRR